MFDSRMNGTSGLAQLDVDVSWRNFLIDTSPAGMTGCISQAQFDQVQVWSNDGTATSARDIRGDLSGETGVVHCPQDASPLIDRLGEERSELLERARDAVELAPKDGNVFNTLALAEYRSGHWAESITAAERSIVLIQGLESFDWFAATERSIASLSAVDPSNWYFLAMAHWQRGEKDRARSYFARAVDWTGSIRSGVSILMRVWRSNRSGRFRSCSC